MRASKPDQGKAVIVTGGGGSIGSEICERVVAFGAARLLDRGKFRAGPLRRHGSARRAGRRGRDRRADRRHRDPRAHHAPDGRVQAGHRVPCCRSSMCRSSSATGARASRPTSSARSNVADAAHSAGAEAMVMISTDKRFEPVSMLGLTKRFAEMYCQRSIMTSRQRAAAPAGNAADLVRFGNVLASNVRWCRSSRPRSRAGGP